MTLRVYVPKVGDRVRVRERALATLGVPRAVLGAKVVSLDGGDGKPVVRLGAEPWATPAAAWGAGRDDGFEVLPRDLWPTDWLPPSELEEELLDVFWTAALALALPGRRVDFEALAERSPSKLVALLADEVEDLRRWYRAFEDGTEEDVAEAKAELEGAHRPQEGEEPAGDEEPDEELPSSQGAPRAPDAALEAELARTVAEAGLPTFDVSAPMPPVKPARKGGPGDSIRDRHRKGGPFDDSDGVDDLDLPPPDDDGSVP